MLAWRLCMLAFIIAVSVAHGPDVCNRRKWNASQTRAARSLVDTDQAQREGYSIGDLHGDHERFRQLLQLLGLATFDEGVLRWTGRDAILVSTGDSVDRGKHGRAIFLDFKALAEQAPKDGGEVVNIVGNHELMNLQGDLRYVHQSEFALNGDYGGRLERSGQWGQLGTIGSDIRKRYVAAAVREGTLFVHAGLDPALLRDYGTNDDSDDPLDPLNAKAKELLDSEVVPYNHMLFGAKGPFWNRFFAIGPEEQVCKKVEETLSMLKARRLVVGHTPQMEGVGVRCATITGPRIILGDTVISRAYELAFGFSHPSVVLYKGDAVTVLYLSEDEQNLRRVPLHLAPTEL